LVGVLEMPLAVNGLYILGVGLWMVRVVGAKPAQRGMRTDESKVEPDSLGKQRWHWLKVGCITDDDPSPTS